MWHRDGHRVRSGGADDTPMGASTLAPSASTSTRTATSISPRFCRSCRRSCSSPSQGPTGDWLYVSQQIEAILGLTAEEWRAHPRPFATYVHEDDFPELLALEEQLLRERDFRPFELEFRMRRRDGTILWIQERARLIERDGQVLVQGMYIDVTAWRDAEMQLGAANRHLGALVDASPLAVMTWDRNGLILTWNPAAERMFGWTEARGSRSLPAAGAG